MKRKAVDQALWFLLAAATAAATAAHAAEVTKKPDANSQAISFASLIARQVMPDNYQDLRKWGGKKEIVSGLNIRLDGLRLRTKRRRKQVNHGTWKMYRLQMPHPERDFEFKVVDLQSQGKGALNMHLVCEAHVNTFGRLQQWQRGVRLLSVSASGNAKVRLTMDCQVAVKFDIAKIPPDVILDPKVTKADLELVEFRLNRVGDLGGEVAQQFAKGLKHILDDRLEKKRQKLVAKMNRQIDKHRDKLRLSLADYVSAKWDKHFGTDEKSQPDASGYDGSDERRSERC